MAIKQEHKAPFDMLIKIITKELKVTKRPAPNTDKESKIKYYRDLIENDIKKMPALKTFFIEYFGEENKENDFDIHAEFLIKEVEGIIAPLQKAKKPKSQKENIGKGEINKHQ